MGSIWERFKSAPGSFRFIAAVVAALVTILNDRYLHLAPEQVNWLNSLILALIGADTLRQIGGNGLVAFKTQVSVNNEPNKPS